jgi:hypothetical protein
MQRVNINRGSKTHKPSKGQKKFLAQNAKALKKSVALASVTSAKNSIPEAMKAQWRKLANWYWKSRFLKGKYTPHQGNQEKARRVRQMTERKCINSEAWL